MSANTLQTKVLHDKGKSKTTQRIICLINNATKLRLHPSQPIHLNQLHINHF